MPHAAPLLAFAAVSLGMALTPGPNMIYLISRSICQGRKAGLISLGGVALGFVFYMLCAAFGITALLMAVPFAYDALRLGGAVYLAWLAWQTLKPGGRSPCQGSVLTQSIELGTVQILLSVTINAMAAITAGTIASFLTGRPKWLALQRYLMGTVLAGLAVRIATEGQR
jgi:threonine/homoserine/homoserine lactone efflux protein